MIGQTNRQTNRDYNNIYNIDLDDNNNNTIDLIIYNNNKTRHSYIFSLLPPKRLDWMGWFFYEHLWVALGWHRLKQIRFFFKYFFKIFFFSHGQYIWISIFNIVCNISESRTILPIQRWIWFNYLLPIQRWIWFKYLLVLYTKDKIFLQNLLQGFNRL